MGEWVVRGEVAHTRTEDGDGDDILIANSGWYAVAGAERQVAYDININMQGFVRSIDNYRSLATIAPQLRPLALPAYLIADQRDERKYGYTLRVSRSWLNDTLDSELLVLESYPRHDYVLRGKVSYAFDDHVRLTLGLDRFRGPRDSYFGRLRSNSTAYGQVAYHF